MFSRWVETSWAKKFKLPYVHIVFGARQPAHPHRGQVDNEPDASRRAPSLDLPRRASATGGAGIHHLPLPAPAPARQQGDCPTLVLFLGHSSARQELFPAPPPPRRWGGPDRPDEEGELVQPGHRRHLVVRPEGKTVEGEVAREVVREDDEGRPDLCPPGPEEERRGGLQERGWRVTPGRITFALT